MTTPGQLAQELQNELTTSNQLLNLISHELQQIKQYTTPGGEFHKNIKKNASLLTTLANLQQINIETIAPIRVLKDLSNVMNQVEARDEQSYNNDSSE